MTSCYPPAAMGKTLIIAEKPSVGQDYSKALGGSFQKHEGYLESGDLKGKCSMTAAKTMPNQSHAFSRNQRRNLAFC